MASNRSNSTKPNLRSPTTLSVVAAAAAASQQQQQQIQQLLQAVSQRRTVVRNPDPNPRNRCCCYFQGFLWLTAIGSLTMLSILTPLLVEPAMATLSRKFQQDPVVCVTASIETKFAGSNLHRDSCSWTSCRQGCTGDLHRCLHVLVHVLLEPWSRQNLSLPREKRATGWAMLWSANEPNLTAALPLTSTAVPETTIRDMPWNATDVPLLVNVKGCGYPPNVVCSEFLDLVGEPGTILPCYVSHNADETVEMAVIQFDAVSAYDTIIFCFLVPLLVFIVTVSGLCCFHCKSLRQPCTKICNKNKNRSRNYKYTEAHQAAQQNWQRVCWRTVHGNRQRVASKGYWDTKQEHEEPMLQPAVQLT